MLKENQYVDVKWGTKNKEWFVSKGYVFTKIGDILRVKAEELMKTSKVKVILVCDICKSNEFETSYYNYSKSLSGEYHCAECTDNRNKITVNCCSCDKVFTSTKTAKRKSKSGNLFCSNKCVGIYNSSQKDKRVEKECTVCKKLYKVKRALSKNSVACSTKCQAKWQSMFLVGENANNYKGGNRIKRCELCNENYTCENPYQVTHRRFCSVYCKEKYWVANTLTSKKFIENRYEGNRLYREKSFSTETKPERMVREWLEDKNIKFKQEQGFFRKYFADFYLPSKKVIIEVMGDYWHANPEIYGNEKISMNETQIKQVKKDKVRKKEFENRGFIYVEIWEKDIYRDIDKVMKQAMLKIYPRNDYTQNIQTVSKSKDDDIV